MWEGFKMDWLFRITRIDDQGGVIESVVEKEGIGRYTKFIKYRIKNDNGVIKYKVESDDDIINYKTKSDDDKKSITFTIQSKQSLVIDPEINIVRKNGLTMRTQEVKDILLKSLVFEDVYDTIPDDFVGTLARQILSNNYLEEPYETFQLAYLIDENTRQPPLKLMTSNIE